MLEALMKWTESGELSAMSADQPVTSAYQQAAPVTAMGYGEVGVKPQAVNPLARRSWRTSTLFRHTTDLL
jgi:hypothetical protein